MAKKKDLEVELKDQQEEIKKYHIYDFIIRCKMPKSQEDILIKKYESQGIKTCQEWESLTGKQLLEIFK